MASSTILAAVSQLDSRLLTAIVEKLQRKLNNFFSVNQLDMCLSCYVTFMFDVANAIFRGP